MNQTDEILAEIRQFTLALSMMQISLARIERARCKDEHLPERRGRKSMPVEERAQVSERMRKYWAGRRSQDV